MAAKRIEGVTEDETAERTADSEPTVMVPAGRPRTTPRSGKPCEVCKAELSIITINVDGTDLLMESCDVCDVRRWQLAGERIDLQDALDHVGEHAGRRR